ncbi:MAG: hypothetical protein ACOY32_16000 [Thermodesulfobacteriota bacterium]
MTDFKKRWDLEMAMAVLENPTIDSDTWSEAVEWLLVYGPAPIRALLSKASQTATRACYPELQPAGFTREGEPCYDLTAIADSLGIDEEEVQRKMTEKEEAHGVRHLFDEEETCKLQ